MPGTGRTVNRWRGNNDMRLDWIQQNENTIIETSKKIWGYAELGRQEYKSSACLQELMRENGFDVTTGLGGLETSIRAVWGSGKPVIGFLGEFDALPELSQKTVAHRSPLVEGRPGHGCGHNLLGTSAAAAAIALRYEMEEQKLPGTVIFWGCPDEEGTMGKIYMAKEGVFSNLDVAVTTHPGIANYANEGIQSSLYTLDFQFYGKASHAAAAPHEGRSALDALELMNISINYLREHVSKNVSMHYIITNGGQKPNVVPAFASSRLSIRGATIQQVQEVYERILNCARGAALMTDTEFEHQIVWACYSFNINETLCKTAYEALEECGPVQWTDKELAFAAKMQGRYDTDTINDSILNYVSYEGMPYLQNEVLHTGIVPYVGRSFYTRGSSDVSDVSWIVPTVEIVTACRPVGVAAHTWEQTSCAGMSIGQKGMLLAARSMYKTGLRLMKDEQLLEKVREEFEESVDGFEYRPVISEKKKRQ